MESTPALVKATTGSAAYDLPSLVNISIPPNHTVTVETGVKVRIPNDYVVTIHGRSGLAIRGAMPKCIDPVNGINCLATQHSIGVLGGVIDSDFIDADTTSNPYANTIKVILHNFSPNMEFSIKKGDRIAQAIIYKVENFDNGIIRDQVKADHAGFGSTGI